jgi:hypothetical protein
MGVMDADVIIRLMATGLALAALIIINGMV